VPNRALINGNVHRRCTLQFGHDGGVVETNETALEPTNRKLPLQSGRSGKAAGHALVGCTYNNAMRALGIPFDYAAGHALVGCTYNNSDWSPSRQPHKKKSPERSLNPVHCWLRLSNSKRTEEGYRVEHQFDEIRSAIRRGLLAWTKDADLVDDVVQSAIEKCLRFKQLNGNLPQPSYAAKIGRNELRSRWRASRAKYRVTRPIPANLVGSLDGPAAPIERRELALRVQAAMSMLSSEERRIVELHHIECTSVRCIADESDVPFDTIKTRLRRANQRLREILHSECD